MRELKLLMLLIPALILMELAPPFEYHLVMAQAGDGATTTENTSLTSQNSPTQNETPTVTGGVSSSDESDDDEKVKDKGNKVKKDKEPKSDKESNVGTILRAISQTVQNIVSTSSESETAVETNTPQLPTTGGTTTDEAEPSTTTPAVVETPQPTPTPTAGGSTTVPVLTPIKTDSPSSSTTYPDIKKEDEKKKAATTTISGTLSPILPDNGSSNNLGDHILNTFTGNPYEFDRFSVATTRILLTIATVLALVGLFFIRGGFGLRSARVTPLFIKEKSYGNQ